MGVAFAFGVRVSDSEEVMEIVDARGEEEYGRGRAIGCRPGEETTPARGCKVLDLLFIAFPLFSGLGTGLGLGLGLVFGLELDFLPSLGGDTSPGIYVLPGHPRAGSAQVLGRTTIGERSYDEGEYAENVRVRVGEGGKRTECACFVVCVFSGGWAVDGK